MDQELLKSLFKYREDGELIRIKTVSNNAKKGDVAGYEHLAREKTYKIIKINKKAYKAHRLIFLYFNGYLPKMIDHIDGNSKNNRIENLRHTNYFQNNQNRNDLRGVYYLKHCKRWNARIQVNYKDINLGYYKNKQDAVFARKKGENKYYGK